MQWPFPRPAPCFYRAAPSEKRAPASQTEKRVLSRTASQNRGRRPGRYTMPAPTMPCPSDQIPPGSGNQSHQMGVLSPRHASPHCRSLPPQVPKPATGDRSRTCRWPKPTIGLTSHRFSDNVHSRSSPRRRCVRHSGARFPRRCWYMYHHQERCRT
jgi:hypothetical protein